MNIENTWLKYGLIYGIFSIVSQLLFYYVMPLGVYIEGFINLIALIVFMVLAVREEKSKYDAESAFPFGSAFVTSFLAGFIGTLISTLFSIILIQLIDPSLVDKLTERMVESTESLMSKMNAPDDQVQIAIEKIEAEMDGKFTPGSLLMSTFFSAFFLAMIAAIIGLIYKREPRIA